MVPFTYHVQVPTYGVVPTAHYGTSHYAYGAIPLNYGAPAPTYASVPPIGYGLPVSSYGAAPTQIYGAPASIVSPINSAAPPVPQTYGANEKDDCKKTCTEVLAKLEKLNGEVSKLREEVSANALNDVAVLGETVKVLQRHEVELQALRSLAVGKYKLEGKNADTKLKELENLEKRVKE